MNSWDVFIILLMAALVIGLIVVIVNGWFLHLVVYGFMAWLGFCGLMHLMIKW
jgi:hypothetical protein